MRQQSSKPDTATRLWSGTRRGARWGLLVGLCLAVLYLVIWALGDIELNKSLGFSLLFIGYPTLFAVVHVLGWLGLQGGTREVVLLILLTLSLNGALWGAVIGTGLSLGSLVIRNR
jgi:hypothetical protein